MRIGRLSAGLVLAASIGTGVSAGQSPRLPYAEATAVAITEPVRAGTTVRAVLQVKVAPGFHVQSDKPRDPSLIPLTLTVDAPAGVSVSKVVFPPPKDFTLKGSDQPLAVFEGAFSIDVQLAVARITRPATSRFRRSCATRPATRRCATGR